MKKFFTDITICFAAMLAWNAVYLVVVDGSLRQYQRQYFNLPESARLLVLGDSHAARAWAGSTDQDVYSFAYGSDNIVDMASKFKYAERTLEKRKKTIALPFDGHLLSVYRETKQNNAVNNIMNHAFLNARLVYALPLFFDANTELDLKRFILNLFAKSDTTSKSRTRLLSKATMQSRFELQFPSDKLSSRLLEQYQKLIDEIRASKHTVVGIKYPLHPFYDSLVKTHPNSIHLNKVMDSLATANAVPIIDLSSYIKDEKLFRDQDHVNVEGSTQFIKVFNEKFNDSSREK